MSEFDTASEYEPQEPDPEELAGYSVDDEDQLQPEDTLVEADVADELDRGYSPPERPSAAQRYGNTEWEQAHPRPIEDRLDEEVPDTEGTGGTGGTEGTDDAAGDDGLPHDADEPGREVGAERAGRLVDPDEGLGEDTEKDLVAEDVGINGGAASAEEAAMHIVEDQPFDDEG